MGARGPRSAAGLAAKWDAGAPTVITLPAALTRKGRGIAQGASLNGEECHALACQPAAPFVLGRDEPVTSSRVGLFRMDYRCALSAHLHSGVVHGGELSRTFRDSRR